jgi:hypothetical protein
MQSNIPTARTNPDLIGTVITDEPPGIDIPPGEIFWRD